MLSVVSVLCTGVAFFVLLEHRYSRLVSLVALAAGGLLCFVPELALALWHPVPEWLTGPVRHNLAMNTVYFLVSLFVFRNSALQKLTLALFSAVHLSVLPTVASLLLGAGGMPVTGAAASFFCSLLYAFFSLLAWILISGPFRVLREQRFSVTWLWCIACPLVLLAAAGGAFDALLGATRYWPRYALCLLLYGITAFSLMALSGAGRYARRSAELAARENHFQTKNEYCRAMRANIEALQELHGLPTQDELKQDRYLSALFTPYSSNPYISAVIATYAADAELGGIRFEYSNSQLTTKLSTMEICSLLTDVLTMALHCAEQSDRADPFIRLSLACAEGQLMIEAVYSDNGEKRAPARFSQGWWLALGRSLLRGKAPSPSSAYFTDTQYLLNQYSGRFSLSHGERESILCIAVRR